MSQCSVHLLDLPNEILLIILKKLDNIDVLYSLFGINNERLDILLQEDVFTNTLNFTRRSSITDNELDRFYTYILPRTHHYVKKLILETTSMERILLAGAYSNLTSLELFSFDQEQISCYFTDDSVFRHIFGHQITDLILYNNDEDDIQMRSDIYTRNVYVPILALFKNLKHLTIVSSSGNEYPYLSVCDLPPTTYFSFTLTVLCINVVQFGDCLCLLDGRLKQLSTFIVQIDYISDWESIPRNKDELHNLKHFSLTSYNCTYHYDELVVPLLRRMTHLETLTLYLRTVKRSELVDGTHFHNEILVHMPQLHRFTFYIRTENFISASLPRKSNDDIQRTFTNIRYGKTACIINYFNDLGLNVICHVYSLPFTFTRLERITNGFPTIVFDTVTHLSVYDKMPMEHEFFMRISRAFPLFKCFSIRNRTKQSRKCDELGSDDNSSYSVIEYSHLTSLDITWVDTDYIEQFLLETKTHLPRLTELKVDYYLLNDVTMNFTRDETRRNCSKVKRLLMNEEIGIFYEYFPSL